MTGLLAVRSPALADLLLRAAPSSRRLRQVLLALFGVAAITLASQIRLPLEPVPVTLQTLAVLSIGAAYGARLSLATVVGWIALGAAGVDVFANGAAGASGLSYIAGPTGGYLVGFALAATTIGALAQRGWDRSVATMAAAMAIGNAVIYAPGVLWLGVLRGFDAPLLQWGLYPFLIGDAMKLIVAALAFPLAWRAVDAAKGGRKP